MTGQTLLFFLVCCPKSLPSRGRTTSPMALPGTAVLSFLLKTQVSPVLRTVLGCLTAQGVFCLQLFFSFSFPFFKFFFFNQSLHIAPESFCVHIGPDDVSSVLGPVSGICLISGFKVAQSTAQIVLLLLMLLRAWLQSSSSWCWKALP